MNLVGKEKLWNFKNKYNDAGSQIDSWIAEVEGAVWNTPRDVKRRYATASIISNNQVIFNIKGNKYRLKVQINYDRKLVLVLNVGTHNEYMKW